MPRRPDPNDPRAIIDEIKAELAGQAFADMTEVQHFLDARMHAYNTRPQRELGGLSPLEMSELIAGDWETTGPLLVYTTLGGDEIGDPELLHHARVFLALLRDDGPAKATAAGNLSRQFVARLLPRNSSSRRSWTRWRPAKATGLSPTRQR
jgi:hypothetical protein